MMPDTEPNAHNDPSVTDGPRDEAIVSTRNPPDPIADALDAQANAIIAGGVAVAAGIGWVPAYIDTAWLVASNAAMVTALAALYQHKWTGDHVREFVTRLVQDSGLTFATIKGLSALMTLTGIGMAPAIALNGTLNAGLTLAIGKSAQHYFKNRGEVPDDELAKFFKQTLAQANPFKGKA
jgi:uncharacterized protein (DUF697 family)